MSDVNDTWEYWCANDITLAAARHRIKHGEDASSVLQAACCALADQLSRTTISNIASSLLSKANEWPAPVSITCEQLQGGDPSQDFKSQHEYNAAHRACPSCGSMGIEQTTMYPMPLPGQSKFADNNRASCGCGWKGRVDDLVEPKRVDPTVIIMPPGSTPEDVRSARILVGWDKPSEPIAADREDVSKHQQWVKEFNASVAAKTAQVLAEHPGEWFDGDERDPVECDTGKLVEAIDDYGNYSKGQLSVSERDGDVVFFSLVCSDGTLPMGHAIWWRFVSVPQVPQDIGAK